MSDVFKNPPPALSNDYVFDIIKKHFDISPSLTPLVSDRDQNFKITEGEKSHIFKIANSAESRSVLEMQNSALSYICLLYTSPSPRDRQKSRMPSSA